MKSRSDVRAVTSVIAVEMSIKTTYAHTVWPWLVHPHAGKARTWHATSATIAR